jgi:hypothetical protein
MDACSEVYDIPDAYMYSPIIFWKMYEPPVLQYQEWTYSRTYNSIQASIYTYEFRMMANDSSLK